MIANAFMLALREIRNNLLRAGLTTLGIVIGVAAVIAMVTLGNGATQSVTSTIASMGRNLLFVTPGVRRGPPSAATNFDEADAEAIAREVPGLAAVAPSVTRSTVAVLGNRNRITTLTRRHQPLFRRARMVGGAGARLLPVGNPGRQVGVHPGRDGARRPVRRQRSGRPEDAGRQGVLRRRRRPSAPRASRAWAAIPTTR
ncbi:MAG: ABC transporter permease [Rhizomicrobium sp.]